MICSSAELAQRCEIGAVGSTPVTLAVGQMILHRRPVVSYVSRYYAWKRGTYLRTRSK